LLDCAGNPEDFPHLPPDSPLSPLPHRGERIKVRGTDMEVVIVPLFMRNDYLFFFLFNLLKKDASLPVSLKMTLSPF
jgi:hypothetical protein